MPFLFILLGVNATLAITRIFTGDTFHMDDIIIANVIGSLFAFMVYNVQRAQVLDKDYAEQRIQLEKIKNDQLQTELKFLKSQYHPHFLFNALNTVYFQIDESNKAASSHVRDDIRTLALPTNMAVIRRSVPTRN